MHTIDELAAADFRYITDGRTVRRDEVMPDISLTDRVGVVMGHGADGLGAGTFVLASVIDFYDTLRERRAEFFEYPDFYTFQATTDPVDYRMFDIYPDHKNVVTDADAEDVLRAVNDRAITILLVPDRAPGSAEISNVNRRSAARRIESCFQYSPRGQLDDGRFVIDSLRRPIEDWFETTVESTVASPNHERWRPAQDASGSPGVSADPAHPGA